MRQGICSGRGAQGMHAKAMHIRIDTHHGTMVLHNVAVHRIRMQVLGQYLGDVVLHRP
jgi:spore maturation protein SpmB